MLTLVLKENKTLNKKKINDLLSFFNSNEDLELENISREIESKTRSKKKTTKCLYSKQSPLNLNKKFNSNYLKNLSQSDLDEFLNKFNPEMVKYSDRSLIPSKPVRIFLPYGRQKFDLFHNSICKCLLYQL